MDDLAEGDALSCVRELVAKADGFFKDAREERAAGRPFVWLREDGRWFVG